MARIERVRWHPPPRVRNPPQPSRRGLGGGAAQQGLDLQTGYCHVDVPRLALVWQADAGAGEQADPPPVTAKLATSAAKDVVPLAAKEVDGDSER